MSVRAHVKEGKLVIDELTTLPEGTVLDLVVDDEGDDLTPAERAALHDAISRADAQAAAGKVRPAADVLASLRATR